MCARARAYTCEHPVDRGVCGEPGLPSLMEDPGVGQVLGQEESAAGRQTEMT